MEKDRYVHKVKIILGRSRYDSVEIVMETVFFKELQGTRIVKSDGWITE